MKFASRELYHEFIVNDLLIKSLEIDHQKTTNFKLKFALDTWFQKALEEAHNERKRIALILRKEGIRYEKLEKDEMFTQFYFLEKGIEQKVNYSNITLRNQVNEAAKALLGFEARKYDKNP